MPSFYSICYYFTALDLLLLFLVSTVDSSLYCMIALHCVYDSFFILSKIELWFGLEVLKLLNEPDIYVQYTHQEFNILFGISVNERVYFLNLITIDFFSSIRKEETNIAHTNSFIYTQSDMHSNSVQFGIAQHRDSINVSIGFLILSVL